MPTTLEQIQYGFDRNSRRMWQRRALSTTQDQHYNYDALSQVNAAARGSLNLNMTAISGVPVSAESWDYDPTGNWRGYHSATNGTPTLDQHRVHDRGNRLTQIEDNPHNMILDRVGRMRQMAPDASGDWDGKLEITWDAWSRITSVKNNGAVVGEYSYDGTHRRITREVAGETLHSYYNEEWRPVEERKDAESTAALSYLWGARHRDDLVRRDRAVGGTTLNESRYLLMDYFNPAAITDADGTVKERYAFSAFGVRTILNPDFTTRNSSECDFVFGFQGQFLDQESGLMNYGYRYYVSYLGRWSSKDPIEEKGGVNLYGMVGNGPLNRIDYLGLISGPFGDCCEPGTKRKAKYKKDYLSIDGMDPSDVDESRKDAEDTLSTRPWNRNPYDAGTKGAARAAVGGYFDHLQSIAQKMQDLKNDIGGYLWVIIDYEKCEKKCFFGPNGIQPSHPTSTNAAVSVFVTLAKLIGSLICYHASLRPRKQQLKNSHIMRSIRLFYHLLLAICCVFVFGCSDQGPAPDLSQWFKETDTPKMVHLDGKLYVGLIKNTAGKVDRLCLTDGGDVILSVEIYGNGRAINVASSGIPGLLVHQSASGIDVTRYLRLPNGALKFVVYGADGQVIEEKKIPGDKK